MSAADNYQSFNENHHSHALNGAGGADGLAYEAEAAAETDGPKEDREVGFQTEDVRVGSQG